MIVFWIPLPNKNRLMNKSPCLLWKMSWMDSMGLWWPMVRLVVARPTLYLGLDHLSITSTAKEARKKFILKVVLSLDASITFLTISKKIRIKLNSVSQCPSSKFIWSKLLICSNSKLLIMEARSQILTFRVHPITSNRLLTPPSEEEWVHKLHSSGRPHRDRISNCVKILKPASLLMDLPKLMLSPKISYTSYLKLVPSAAPLITQQWIKTPVGHMPCCRSLLSSAGLKLQKKSLPLAKVVKAKGKAGKISIKALEV